MKHQPFTLEEFRSIYSQVPRLTVEVIIKNENGLLLTLRKIQPFQNLWHIPGGTVYFKEPISIAVSRVAKEELGVEVQIEKFLGYIEYLHQDDIGNWFDHPVGLVFLCNQISVTLL